MEVKIEALLRDLAADLEAMGFGGDESLVLIEALAEVLRENLPPLRQAVAGGKNDEIAFFAHSLKGTFNNFALPAFVRLAAFFAELEYEAKTPTGAAPAAAKLAQIEAELAPWLG